MRFFSKKNRARLNTGSHRWLKLIHHERSGFFISLPSLILVAILCGCKSSGSSKNVKTAPGAGITFVTNEPKKLTYQDIVKRFDKNKDGVLDDGEIMEMQKQLGSRQATFSSTNSYDQPIKKAWVLPANSGGSSTGDPIIDKYDLNHDGIIDEREAELLKKDLRGETEPKLQNPSKQKKTANPIVNTPVIKNQRRPLVR